MCSLITLFHELTGRAMSLLPVATVDAPGVADLFAGIGNVLWGFAKAGFQVCAVVTSVLLIGTNTHLFVQLPALGQVGRATCCALRVCVVSLLHFVIKPVALCLLFPSGKAGRGAESARLHCAEQQLCASRAGQAAAGEPGGGACFVCLACCARFAREGRRGSCQIRSEFLGSCAAHQWVRVRSAGRTSVMANRLCARRRAATNPTLQPLNERRRLRRQRRENRDTPVSGGCGCAAYCSRAPMCP